MGFKDRLIRALIAFGILFMAGIFAAVAVGLLIATLYLALDEIMEAWQAMGLTALLVLLAAFLLLLLARGMTRKRAPQSYHPADERLAQAQMPQAEHLRSVSSPADLALRMFSRWSGGHAREGVLSLFALGLLLGALPETRALISRRRWRKRAGKRKQDQKDD